MALLKNNQSDDLTLKYLLQNATKDDRDDIEQLKTLIGDTPLTTTDQTVTGAIDELDDDIATLSATVDGKVAKAGDTMTGALQLNSSNVEGGVVPSGGQYGDTELALYDKNGARFGYLLPYNYEGVQGIILSAVRNVGGSDIYHGVQIGIDGNGNRSIYFDNRSSWRYGIGIRETEAHVTTGSSTYYGFYYGDITPPSNAWTKSNTISVVVTSCTQNKPAFVMWTNEGNLRAFANAASTTVYVKITYLV